MTQSRLTVPTNARATFCRIATFLFKRDRLAPIYIHRREERGWPNLLAGTEALGFVYRGVSPVSRPCRLPPVIITKDLRELAQPLLPEDRVLREGGAGMASGGSRPEAGRGFGHDDGTLQARRSRFAVALELQEHAQPGAGTNGRP